MSDRFSPVGSGLEPGDELFLSTPRIDADLHGRSVRGTAAALVGQAGKFTLQVVTTVVLARLLSPEDFGLYAFAFAIIGVVGLFKDLGFSYAAIQGPTLSHREASTLFWLNAAVGIGLAVVIVAAAPLIGWIIGTPGLTLVLVALAAVLPLGALASQHQALLVRQIRFGVLAVVEIAAFALGLVAGVVSAVLGAGYWALVASYAAIEVARATGAWGVCHWRPSLPSRGTGIRPLLSLGGYLTGIRVLHTLSFAFDKLAIGSYAGARQLGLYDRASTLLFLPINLFTAPFWHVAYTTLSRLQSDAARYRAQLRAFVLISSALGMPAVAFLFVVVETLVPALLGSQWNGSIALFLALAPIGFVASVSSAAGWIYLSLARARRQFAWTLGTTAGSAAAVVVGLQWGALGVAIGLSAWHVATVVPTLAFTCAGTFVRWTDVVRAATRPAVAAVAAALLLAGANELLPGLRPAVDLVLDAIVYAVLYMGVWLALPGGRRVLREQAAAIRLLLRRAPPVARG